MESEENSPPGAILLFAIPVSLLGLVFARDALSNGLKSREIQQNWIVVPAKILSRKVQETFPPEPGKNPTWRPSVVYEYALRGRHYECDHVDVRWKEGTSDPSGPEAVIAPYVQGRDVRVYVNPQDPSDAVLDATPMVSWVEMSSGIGLGSLALLFGFAVYRTAGRLQRPSPGPILLGFLWIVLSAAGLGCSAIAGRTPKGVWIATGLHAVVGVALAAWQIRGMARGRNRA